MPGSKEDPKKTADSRGWPRSTGVEMAKKLREDAPLGFPADLARDGTPGDLGWDGMKPVQNREPPFTKVKGGR